MAPATLCGGAAHAAPRSSRGATPLPRRRGAHAAPERRAHGTGVIAQCQDGHVQRRSVLQGGSALLSAVVLGGMSVGAAVADEEGEASQQACQAHCDFISFA